MVCDGVPASVKDKIARGLHKQPNHPVCITKQLVYDYFQRACGPLRTFEDLPPQVSVKENFDDLLIPCGHSARSVRDTFYLDTATVLRTHTTAHQAGLLAAGNRSFLITGDVFRRDTIDKTHFPVFHQTEGVVPVPPGEEAETYLRRLMVGLVEFLFPGCPHRVAVDHFPFTDPSLEVEVLYADSWLEVLGCGVVHPTICERAGCEPLVAWGVGLERLAMVLFAIPDIRLFWREEEVFTGQFKAGRIDRFVPYSGVQPVRRDISFLLPADRLAGGEWVDANLFHELVREHSDHVESVTLYDKYSTQQCRVSHTFALLFAPVAWLRNCAELAELATRTTEKIGGAAVQQLGVELR